MHLLLRLNNTHVYYFVRDFIILENTAAFLKRTPSRSYSVPCRMKLSDDTALSSSEYDMSVKRQRRKPSERSIDQVLHLITQLADGDRATILNIAYLKVTRLYLGRALLFRHPADVDLWSGGVSERPLPGSMLGPTFACLIATQFGHSRRGDRFWYELPNQPSSFTLGEKEPFRIRGSRAFQGLNR